MLFRSNPPALPFSQWCWKESANKRLLLLASLVMLIHFAWFKLLYSYPNFIPDSYRYIIAAQTDAFADMRPIGYSRFLRVVSCFTTSHFLLVLLQFLLLQAAGLYFLFTIGYLFQHNKWLLRALVLLQVANPLLSHISNLITSDALFTAISLVWFTQLLWMQYRPSAFLFLSHALIVLLAFSIRYNALWYPIVSAISIFLASVRFPAKLAYTGVIGVLLAAFVTSTRAENRRQFGVDVFSGFSGWQLAANALVVYEHLPGDPVSSVPPHLQPLHRLVNKHMDSLHRFRRQPDSTMNVYYMWTKNSPLNVYMSFNEPGQSNPLFVKQWVNAGLLYHQYGRYLIQRHPGGFMRYFIQPNIRNYFFPNPEFLRFYNTGSNRVSQEAVEWSKWQRNIIYSRGAKRIQSMDTFIFLHFIMNLLFILGSLGFIITGRSASVNTPSQKALWLTALVWVANMGFNIFSTIVALRYQAFVLTITFAFSMLFISHIAHQTQPSK